MQLTQKETELLKDLKEEETLCVDKYSRHASCAKDAQLQSLFRQIAENEQHHLDTIVKMQQGEVPKMSSGSSSSQPTFSPTYRTADSEDKKSDRYLCNDVLSTEKHASHLYDTCIFEFKDENARNVLNHIQKEEQEHGKMIYDYMSTNSMYS